MSVQINEALKYIAQAKQEVKAIFGQDYDPQACQQVALELLDKAEESLAE